MDWQPITTEELSGLGRRIDSELVVADSMEDIYLQLNTKYNSGEWVILRTPVWCGDKLVAVVLRPRKE